MPTIMDYFPKGKRPREVQTQVLEEIERKWQKVDVFAVNLPTGSGKSLIAITMAAWARAKHHKQSAITTPTKGLVLQYEEMAPRLPTLKSREDYRCSSYERSCGRTKDREGGYCKGCSYVKAIRKAKAVPYVLANNYTYYAHKLYRNCLIADEAHNLIGMLRDLNSHKLWWHDYHFPTGLSSYQGIADWVEKHPDRDTDKKLATLWKDLTSGKPRYLLDHTWEPFGRSREVRRLLKMTPIDIKDISSERAHPLWPDGKTKKVILLSATLSHKDVEQLGLSHRRVCFIHANSPIAAERRPIVNDFVCRVTHGERDRAVPLLAEKVKSLLKENSGRGLIHVTYSLSRDLQLAMGEADPRLIWHTKEDKAERFIEFKESRDGVLVACGLQEGVDLPYDEARWQAIAKVPWPSLAEPAVKFMAEEDPEWLAWEAVRKVLQASGRVCRTLDDYGVTYILDATFKSLYDGHRDLFPKWYQEAVR